MSSSGLRCDIALTIANATGAAQHHLDPLHRRALHAASVSTC
ncbi:hypothetical protein [Kribbella sp. NPDC048915]